MFNRLAAGIAERVAKAGEKGIFPAVITSARRRRFLRTVVAAKGIAAPVLSFDEIGLDARPAIVGLVTP
jgi:flagellar biosynthesis protein FlhA